MVGFLAIFQWRYGRRYLAMNTNKSKILSLIALALLSSTTYEFFGKEYVPIMSEVCMKPDLYVKPALLNCGSVPEQVWSWSLYQPDSKNNKPESLPVSWNQENDQWEAVFIAVCTLKLSETCINFSLNNVIKSCFGVYLNIEFFVPFNTRANYKF